MRLLVAESIRTPRLETVEFHGEPGPYAILSHTWTVDEVILTDVINGTAPQKGGYEKVRLTCEQAISDGLTYVWIDTCCIDKTSSAELSEAINSMFAWYRQSSICYVYLSDLFAGVDSLDKCRWFTRGFTLQELIAPSHMVFYAGDEWVCIGDKVSLSGELARITSISEEILTGARRFDTASIANRMGWAAWRETTRPEDVAYCLMGIFDVNMPLLYGEGGIKAFRRLQEEIMKQSTDHSLFVWQDHDASDITECGLLAPSPRCFQSTRPIVPFHQWEQRRPHTMTNEGLSMDIYVIPCMQKESNKVEVDELGRKVFHGVLDCPMPDFRPGHFVAVYLVRPDLANTQYYARIWPTQIGSVMAWMVQSGKAGQREQIYISSSPQYRPPEMERIYPWHHLLVASGSPALHYFARKAVAVDYGSSGEAHTRTRFVSERQFEMGHSWNPSLSSSLGKMNIHRGYSKMTAAILFERRADGRRLIVIIGSLDTFRLGFSAHEVESMYPEADITRSQSAGSGMPPSDVLQRLFVPTLVGQTVMLPNHEVTVTAKSLASSTSMSYNVTISIEQVGAPATVISNDQGSEPSVVTSARSIKKSRVRNIFNAVRG